MRRRKSHRPKRKTGHKPFTPRIPKGHTPEFYKPLVVFSGAIVFDFIFLSRLNEFLYYSLLLITAGLFIWLISAYGSTCPWCLKSFVKTNYSKVIGKWNAWETRNQTGTTRDPEGKLISTTSTPVQVRVTKIKKRHQPYCKNCGYRWKPYFTTSSFRK